MPSYTENLLPAICFYTRCFFLRRTLATVGLLLITVTGCGVSGGGAPEAQRSHLYRLATVYNLYNRTHRQPPADENAFKEYIASLSESQRSKLQADDIEAFFTSPRDGEKYVILYGNQAHKNPSGVIAYEQTGAEDGSRMLATSLGDVSSVDEAEFLKLTSTTKKKKP